LLERKRKKKGGRGDVPPTASLVDFTIYRPVFVLYDRVSAGRGKEEKKKKGKGGTENVSIHHQSLKTILKPPFSRRGEPSSPPR